MTLETWVFYVLAILAMMSTPGPSQLLMLSNSTQYGFKASLFTACGDLSANILQMLAAGLGLAALIVASSTLFNAIKWAGVCYLLWLGVRMFMRAGRYPRGVDVSHSGKTRKKLWLQGFLTSAANPRAIVFFASLFPQFISPTAPLWPQLTILMITYLTIDAIFLSSYAYSADWLAKRFKGEARKWSERIGGGCMFMAAVLLGLKSVTK